MGCSDLRYRTHGSFKVNILEVSWGDFRIMKKADICPELGSIPEMSVLIRTNSTLLKVLGHYYPLL